MNDTKQQQTPSVKCSGSYTPDPNRTVDFSEEDLDKRFEGIPECEEMSKQEGEILPPLLERFIVCRNYHRAGAYGASDTDTEAYLRLLVADLVSVLLDQQKRIQFLEGEVENIKYPV